MKDYDEDNVSINVNKKEGMHFYSATIGKLKFLDSCNMIKTSLSDLGIHHTLNDSDLTLVKDTLNGYSTESQDLLCRTGKQFFPYEYIVDIEKLKETSLPPINEFYSSLMDSNITTSDYQHAQDVWDKTNCSTLKDYVNVHLNLDVALLADIYPQWRSVLLELFDLDCLYFLTLSSYAIEAMYHKCGIKLDSISDPSLCHMINSNIRGGLCSVGKRHIVANNIHANPNFDSQSMESNYLLYVDYNSLYPGVMSKFKLPTGDFVELNEMELNIFKNQDITNIDIEGYTGYYIYCDIKPIKREIIENKQIHILF